MKPKYQIYKLVILPGQHPALNTLQVASYPYESIGAAEQAIAEMKKHYDETYTILPIY